MGRLRTGTVLSVHNEGTLIRLLIEEDGGLQVVACGDHRPMMCAMERLEEDGDIAGMRVSFALTDYGALFMLGREGCFEATAYQGRRPAKQRRLANEVVVKPDR